MENTRKDQHLSCLELTMAVPGLSSSSGYDGGGGSGCNARGLDMNQPACGYEEYTMGVVDDDEDGTGAARPKKLRLSKEQSRLLEESFGQNQNLNPKRKEALASRLNLRPRQVEVWFQNRRARTKLKQTEMECEYLKRCFGSLTEENRRLQREVEELRALRLAPPTVISPYSRVPMPASSLTMCPRCERVTASNAAGPSAGDGGGAGGLPFARSGTLRHRHPSPAAC